MPLHCVFPTRRVFPTHRVLCYIYPIGCGAFEWAFDGGSGIPKCEIKDFDVNNYATAENPIRTYRVLVSAGSLYHIFHVAIW